MKLLIILIHPEEPIPIINQLVATEIITRLKQILIFKHNLPKFHQSINQALQIKTQTQVKHRNLFNHNMDLLNFSLVAVEMVKYMNVIECTLH